MEAYPEEMRGVLTQKAAELVQNVEEWSKPEPILDEKTGRIGYKEKDEVSYDISYSNQTTFACILGVTGTLMELRSIEGFETVLQNEYGFKHFTITPSIFAGGRLLFNPGEHVQVRVHLKLGALQVPGLKAPVLCRCSQAHRCTHSFNVYQVFVASRYSVVASAQYMIVGM